MYVGVDSGDSFYDNDKNEKEILQWFDKHVATKATILGAHVSLKVILFVNKDHKPGPAFNKACKAAYDEGKRILELDGDRAFLAPSLMCFFLFYGCHDLFFCNVANSVRKGADYMYRVNDDSEFRTTFAKPYIVRACVCFVSPVAGDTVCSRRVLTSEQCLLTSQPFAVM